MALAALTRDQIPQESTAATTANAIVSTSHVLRVGFRLPAFFEARALPRDGALSSV